MEFEDAARERRKMDGRVMEGEVDEFVSRNVVDLERCR